MMSAIQSQAKKQSERLKAGEGVDRKGEVTGSGLVDFLFFLSFPSSSRIKSRPTTRT